MSAQSGESWRKSLPCARLPRPRARGPRRRGRGRCRRGAAVTHRHPAARRPVPGGFKTEPAHRLFRHLGPLCIGQLAVRPRLGGERQVPTCAAGDLRAEQHCREVHSRRQPLQFGLVGRRPASTRSDAEAATTWGPRARCTSQGRTGSAPRPRAPGPASPSRSRLRPLVPHASAPPRGSPLHGR